MDQVKIFSRVQTPVLAGVAIIFTALLILAYFHIIKPTKPNVARDTPSQYQKIEEDWKRRFEEQDPERAYAEFLRAGNALSYYKAHSLSHIIGEIVFKRLGIRGIALCTPDFGYGCYHGFAGSALQDRGLALVADLNDACESVKNPRVAFGCIHGIGHGILAYVGNEELPRALEACVPLNDGVSDVGGCLGGIFMEYNYNTMRSLKGIDLRPYDIPHAYEPCATQIPERFRAACYYEQPSWWRATFGGNNADTLEQFKKVGRLCADIKGTSLRDICFRGAGNVIGPRSEYRPTVMRELCSAMPSDGSQDSCLHEALNHLLQSDKGKTELRAMCESKEISYEDLCRQN